MHLTHAVRTEEMTEATEMTVETKSTIVARKILTKLKIGEHKKSKR